MRFGDLETKRWVREQYAYKLIRYCKFDLWAIKVLRSRLQNLGRDHLNRATNQSQPTFSHFISNPITPSIAD